MGTYYNGYYDRSIGSRSISCFHKTAGSKKNCAHQSRAQNSLCSSNILLLYIYKTNLPNFHTYTKPIFLTKKPNLPNMLFILFYLYICQLPQNVYIYTHTGPHNVHPHTGIQKVHPHTQRLYIHTRRDTLYIHTHKDTDCTSTHTGIQTVQGYRLYIHTHTDTDWSEAELMAQSKSTHSWKPKLKRSECGHQMDGWL